MHAITPAHLYKAASIIAAGVVVGAIIAAFIIKANYDLRTHPGAVVRIDRRSGQMWRVEPTGGGYVMAPIPEQAEH